jgi:FixJ family two-component response regulator
MTHHGLTVVVIDDDDSVRLALQELLRAAGFDARSFASAEEFLAADSERGLADPACLIADINLPGQSGVALTRALAATGRRIPTVFISARDDATTLALVRAAGPIPFLRKPFSEDELLDAMSLAMRKL